MLTEGSLIAAFAIGLLGGVHCFGMCGGIVTALTMGLPEHIRTSPRAALPYFVAYHGGRVMSYAVAGALAGAAGAAAFSWVPMQQSKLILQMFAGLFMVALGLYLSQMWMGLRHIESLGAGLWRRLAPLGRNLLPLRTPIHALAAGLLWGWLPCGLVYSVMVWALSAGSAWQGALLMASFGVGTLPLLLTMSLSSQILGAALQRRGVRLAAGGMVSAYGAYLFAIAALGMSARQ